MSLDVSNLPPYQSTDSSLQDSEFTQLMKGLQGERLRQAFKYLDSDQDGFIRPEQFKQIILVRTLLTNIPNYVVNSARFHFHRNSLGTNFRTQS